MYVYCAADQCIFATKKEKKWLWIHQMMSIKACSAVIADINYYLYIKYIIKCCIISNSIYCKMDSNFSMTYVKHVKQMNITHDFIIYKKRNLLDGYLVVL